MSSQETQPKPGNLINYSVKEKARHHSVAMSVVGGVALVGGLTIGFINDHGPYLQAKEEYPGRAYQELVDADNIVVRFERDKGSAIRRRVQPPVEEERIQQARSLLAAEMLRKQTMEKRRKELSAQRDHKGEYGMMLAGFALVVIGLMRLTQQAGQRIRDNNHELEMHFEKMMNNNPWRPKKSSQSSA